MGIISDERVVEKLMLTVMGAKDQAQYVDLNVPKITGGVVQNLMLGMDSALVGGPQETSTLSIQILSESEVPLELRETGAIRLVLKKVQNAIRIPGMAHDYMKPSAIKYYNIPTNFLPYVIMHELECPIAHGKSNGCKSTLVRELTVTKYHLALEPDKYRAYLEWRRDFFDGMVRYFRAEIAKNNQYSEWFTERLSEMQASLQCIEKVLQK